MDNPARRRSPDAKAPAERRTAAGARSVADGLTADHNTPTGSAVPSHRIVIEREAFGPNFDVRIEPPLSGRESMDKDFPSIDAARGYAGDIQASCGFPIADKTCEATARGAAGASHLAQVLHLMERARRDGTICLEDPDQMLFGMATSLAQLFVDGHQRFTRSETATIIGAGALLLRQLSAATGHDRLADFLADRAAEHRATGR